MLPSAKHKLPYDETAQGRLIKYGASILSFVELLSLFVDEKKDSAASQQEMATEIISQLNTGGGGRGSGDYLEELRHITVEQLEQHQGVNRERAAVIVAAIELGKRVFNQSPPSGTVIDDPAVAAAALAKDLMWQSVEHFGVLYLNFRHQLIGKEIISKGTAGETLAYPRDVFRNAVKRNATRIIVAHNHPSGSLEASTEDLTLTRQMIVAGDNLAIPVMDHLILGKGDWSSIRQTTDIWNEKLGWRDAIK